MTKNQAKMGFTLIELLVVVLIIGILAAVALPQYNKAVTKTRISNIFTVAETFMKAMDIWRLENSGVPNGVHYFTGDAADQLNITYHWDSCSSNKCENNSGKWIISCSTMIGSGICGVSVSNLKNIKPKGIIEWHWNPYVYGDDNWHLTRVPSSSVCYEEDDCWDETNSTGELVEKMWNDLHH